MTFQIKLLAPWLSVILFWCVFENAWLALLGYHLQIVCWNHKALRSVFAGFTARNFALFALPAIFAGPAIYVLLPQIIEQPLAQWLARYQLSGWWLIAMVPYFGVVHPLLEQAHWGPLREKTPIAHGMFAGYHLLVLYTLLPVLWLVIAFAVLVAASVFWQRIAVKSGGLAIPCCSHGLADLSIITAACWLGPVHPI